jgi:hypothetical protein
VAYLYIVLSFIGIDSNCFHRYVLENLKFGKVDVGRYPDAAKKYNINDSSMSRQLPTVILFKNGKEITRRPAADNRGKLVKFFFSEVKDFGYNYDLQYLNLDYLLKVLIFIFALCNILQDDANKSHTLISQSYRRKACVQ